MSHFWLPKFSRYPRSGIHNYACGSTSRESHGKDTIYVVGGTNEITKITCQKCMDSAIFRELCTVVELTDRKWTSSEVRDWCNEHWESYDKRKT